MVWGLRGLGFRGFGVSTGALKGSKKGSGSFKGTGTYRYSEILGIEHFGFRTVIEFRVPMGPGLRMYGFYATESENPKPRNSKP